jgi:hypothetical protein
MTIASFAFALLLSFGPWTTLGPTIAEEDYGGQAAFGLLASAMGAGTMIGALLGFRWRPLHPMRTGFLWMLPWPLVTVGFAVGMPLLALVPLFAVAGVGLSLFGIWWDTALAERIPPHTLSRVSSYDWMGSLVLLPIGYLLAGPLGEALGAALVLGVGSALAALVLAGGLAVRENWTLRRLEPA